VRLAPGRKVAVRLISSRDEVPMGMKPGCGAPEGLEGQGVVGEGNATEGEWICGRPNPLLGTDGTAGTVRTRLLQAPAT